MYSGELSMKKYSNRKIGWIEELRTSPYVVWDYHGQKITDFMLYSNFQSLNTFNFISHLHFRVNGCLSFFEGTSYDKVEEKVIII